MHALVFLIMFLSTSIAFSQSSGKSSNGKVSGSVLNKVEKVEKVEKDDDDDDDDDDDEKPRASLPMPSAAIPASLLMMILAFRRRAGSSTSLRCRTRDCAV